MSRTAQFLLYFAFLATLFLTYGALVRRGTIKGRNILLLGLPLGLVAMIAAAAQQWPEYAAHRIPLQVVILNALMMLWVTIFCVMMAYRSQRVEDVGTYSLGDTKVIVRVAPPGRIPDAQALLLPTVTTLRMTDGVAGLVGVAVGNELHQEAKRLGPVGMGKVVQTGGGNLAVGRIYHAAVADPLKPVELAHLRRGMEAAAQRARKANAESIAVPVGPLRGLETSVVAEAIAESVLKQRKAFAEVVFLILEPRYAREVQKALEKTVTSLVEASSLSS